MNIKVALSNMKLIANQGSKGHLQVCGLTEDDFQKIVADVPWVGSDRNRLAQHFNSILFSTLDAVGLPRFTLPAEYIAAGIAMLIADVNIHAACRFFEKAPTVDSVAADVEFEPCSANQLFSLVLLLKADPERSSARALFEKKCGVNMERKQIANTSTEK